LRESATLWNYQNYWLVELTQTGLITTLRLLFARQAKGKRKLVIWGFYDSHPAITDNEGRERRTDEPRFYTQCPNK
jgi:hypothetical protein